MNFFNGMYVNDSHNGPETALELFVLEHYAVTKDQKKVPVIDD
jgi:hypothetical protein